jgi:hypothetical protein
VCSVGDLYLGREGNLKDRGSGQQDLPGGAVETSAMSLGWGGEFYVEVRVEVWVLHPQTLQEPDSGPVVDAVFLSTT